MPVIKQQMVFLGRGGVPFLFGELLYRDKCFKNEGFDAPLTCEVSGRNNPFSSVVMVPKVD